MNTLRAVTALAFICFAKVSKRFKDYIQSNTKYCFFFTLDRSQSVRSAIFLSRTLLSIVTFTMWQTFGFTTRVFRIQTIWFNVSIIMSTTTVSPIEFTKIPSKFIYIILPKTMSPTQATKILFTFIHTIIFTIVSTAIRFTKATAVSIASSPTTVFIIYSSVASVTCFTTMYTTSSTTNPTSTCYAAKINASYVYASTDGPLSSTSMRFS